ncbi:MAG: HAD family hydrolase [Muribaculaceae bacterium]|jgi:HAD superfamily hydrolase (TIGR01509 family)|nr:HAD family hydrolase [Muribaculaceae bacterium]
MIEKNKELKCAVLFDLDGVLLDSEGQYSIFWEQMDHEYPTGIQQFASFIKGFHLARILNYFENEDVRQQVLDKLLEFERHMNYEFFPGALEFVKELRSAGIPMAIVTSSDHKKMQALYSQYPEFPTLFDKIVTGDMVTKAKPDPDCFLMGARQLGVDIKDCIVFEDSRNGLIAGRESGALVIGISTTLDRDTVGQLSDLTLNAVEELTVERMLEIQRLHLKS